MKLSFLLVIYDAISGQCYLVLENEARKTSINMVVLCAADVLLKKLDNQKRCILSEITRTVELFDSRISSNSTLEATTESFRKLLSTKYEYVEIQDNTVVSSCHNSDISMVLKQARSARNEQIVMRD